jgi:hypothetical protein
VWRTSSPPQLFSAGRKSCLTSLRAPSLLALNDVLGHCALLHIVGGYSPALNDRAGLRRSRSTSKDRAFPVNLNVGSPGSGCASSAWDRPAAPTRSGADPHQPAVAHLSVRNPGRLARQACRRLARQACRISSCGPGETGPSYACTTRVESSIGASRIYDAGPGESICKRTNEPETSSPAMVPSNRTTVADHRVRADISGGNLGNCLFVRLVAKKRTFRNVDFKYSIFDMCYFRDCLFDSCDFTGCRFVGSNLYGAKFSGCNFEYSWFERTLIDNSILDTECPGLDNLKLKFARTLRMNYQQIGDAQSANKAIGVELEAKQSDLYKAWHSNESYYRKKYAGLRRLRVFAKWLSFKILDIVWGNDGS